MVNISYWRENIVSLSQNNLFVVEYSVYNKFYLRNEYYFI